jgi:hypothetical protein
VSGRWWRPRPLLTGRELADEVGRRRLARGIKTPTPIIADPLDEDDACKNGCHPDHLYRVVQAEALVGSMICKECGTVYRRDTP